MPRDLAQNLMVMVTTTVVAAVGPLHDDWHEASQPHLCM
jgi:hypothetical protein